MTTEKKKSILWMLIGCILIIAADQLTKQLIIHHYAEGEGTPLIEGVFELHHIHNSGSAFGMLSGKTFFLTLFSLLLIGAIIYVLIHILGDPRYRILRIIFTCILGGALGNMIDRIRLGYVTDFLYFKLIDFPVFNVADIFVTLPVILLIILLIFKFRGDDLDVLLGDKIHNPDGTYTEKEKGKKASEEADTEKEEKRE
ncbi:MAG: signal peptidase II [Eubacterium sp.]|nr:signal peptidase II [Eubacterium sp.]